MAEIKMGSAVANRIETGNFVVTSVDMTGADVASSLREICGEVQVLELNPSQVLPFVRAMAAVLRAATQELESKELTYLEELADDVEPRAMRDEKAAVGIEMLTRAKELITGSLGAGHLQDYGLETPLSRSPHDVAEQMRKTIGLLESKAMTATDPLGVEFDSAKIAAKLGSISTDLDEALAVLAKEEQERVDALAARDEAVEAWTGIYRGVATTLTGLYRLAGFENLAERLLPTEERAAGRESKDA